MIPLKTGESSRGTISYGLYYIASGSRAASYAPARCDLILILRNNGAKWIDLTDATVENFSLDDSLGKKIELHLRNKLRGIGYGDSEVVQLITSKSTGAPEPWTLSFKSADTFVRADFSIQGIQISKTAQDIEGQKPSR